MRAISLWQPWASAIPAGLKTIETRSWATNYRGPLAIHAAKRWTKAEREIWLKLVCATPHASRKFEEIGITYSEDIPLGAIVATCELYDCISTNDPPQKNHEITEAESEWGNYSADRFCWLLRDIKALPDPVRFIGRQGFFDWTP